MAIGGLLAAAQKHLALAAVPLCFTLIDNCTPSNAASAQPTSPVMARSATVQLNILLLIQQTCESPTHQQSTTDHSNED
jgi:hypothetical protein